MAFVRASLQLQCLRNASSFSASVSYARIARVSLKLSVSRND